MNAHSIVNRLLESSPRQKLNNGCVVNHPYFGRLTIKVDFRDNVIGHPELWNAYDERGKQAVPSCYSEIEMNRILKRYSVNRSYTFEA